MASRAQEILPPEEDDAPVLIGRIKLFAEGILSGKNGTQAAIDAGYSERTAGVQASQILKKTEVAEYLRVMRARAAEKNTYDAAKWKRELIGIAHSNVADFTRLNSDGDLEVDFSGATREQLAAVSGVKVKKRKIYDSRGNVVGEEHQSEFRLWDKLRAAELLGKHSGFLAEPEQKIVIDVADRLLRARQRVLALPEQRGGSALGDDVSAED